MTAIGRKILINIAILWLVWRTCTLLTSIFALNALPFTVTFSNYALQEQSTLPVFWERWTNFDGGAYLILSDVGYQKVGLLQAYFPMYPLVIRGITAMITFFGGHTSTEILNIRTIVALSVASVCSFFFLIVSYVYLRERFSKDFIFLFLLVFVTFPTSFFLHAAYTESLFLVFTILSLYFFKKKNWAMTSLMLWLATATRIVGIFLIPAFILELYFQQEEPTSFKKFVRSILHFLKSNGLPLFFITLGSLGLLNYMLYLFIYFKDPLLFFHVQSEFGAGRQEKLILFPQVMWRYFKIFWTVRPIDWKYFTYIVEFVSAMSGVFFIGYMVKYIRRYKITISEAVFCTVAFFLPTLTGNFSSMSRYILVCFPFFIILTHWLYKRKIAQLFYFTFAILLGLINIVLFIQGHWVA
jgi:Gpi18-like mannosyltransferase